MKWGCILTALLSLLQMCRVSHVALDDSVKKAYDQWKMKHNGSTQPLSEEEAYANFKKTIQDITLQNLKFYSGKSKFQMKLNGRAADTAVMMSKWNGLIPIKTKLAPKDLPSTDASPAPLPASLDYRQQGLVARVQDQGYYCGSCYAFSATCALEGQIAKKYGMLVELSEQNIVDCSQDTGNFGCNGGYMGASYDYIKNNHGVANDTIYQYSGTDEACFYNSTMAMSYVSVSDYFYVEGDEENLKRVLVERGPIAVGIKADVESFYFYSSGILDDPTCVGDVNHAVCIVGYGTDNSTIPPTDYWIIKNSWSTEWGENGYFRMQFGSNMCGITSYAMYPTN